MEKEIVLKEKRCDNVSGKVSSEKQHPIRSFRSFDVSLLKERVRSRIAKNDAAFAKLDDRFEDMRNCVLKIIGMIDECKDVVKVERRGGKELLMILRDNSTPGSSKTNIVTPMVCGLPLKRAQISLKRLTTYPTPRHARRGSVSQVTEEVTHSTPRHSSRNANSGSQPSSSHVPTLRNGVASRKNSRL